jgi:flavorubredoxin
MPSPADEIIAGTVYRMGSSVELDGGVSWAPVERGRIQPISCYLVLDKGEATLIDTGPALFRPIIMKQLATIRPKDVALTAFMTRSELECSGNLAAIHEADPVSRVIIGGGQNPFDGYDEVTRGAGKTVERQVLPNTSNAVAPLGSSRRLLVIPTRFRILTTYWLYDQVDKILFSSDVFGHTSQSPGRPVVLTSVEEDDSNRESIERHLFSKYAWLKDARTAPLRNWLTQLFDQYPIETVAPSHGCVLQGPDLVQRHFSILQDILGAIRH